MSQPRTTPLIDLHRELGGRLVDFAGWELPIQYQGVIAEHQHCRNQAGLFDVSHMGVLEIRGDNPSQALERVTPAGISTLTTGAMRYGLLTADSGGILDDLMVTNWGDHLVVVVNASRREQDLVHIRSMLPDCEVTERTDVALLALQGPQAAAVLAQHCPEAEGLYFLESCQTRFSGLGAGNLDEIPFTVSRSGYTGEDGFELIVPADHAADIARALLSNSAVEPCGLGARDTLRLEAGLCLYGQDLDPFINPVEADLRWTMPKRRRQAGDFPGAEPIMADFDNGPSRIRVGLEPDGKRPMREGTELCSPDGAVVGLVTSGGYGPTVEHPVAMGYVSSALSDPRTELTATVRGKDVLVRTSALPFVPHSYHRRPKGD